MAFKDLLKSETDAKNKATNEATEAKSISSETEAEKSTQKLNGEAHQPY